jgi:sensor histidine kinase YesM
MLKVKVYTYLLHLAAWLLFMALPLLFLNDRGQNSNYLLLLSQPYYWLFGATYITLFYFNTLLLIPAFLLKKRYLVYASILVVLLGLINILQPYDKLLMSSEGSFPAFRHHRPPPNGGDDYGMHGSPPPPGFGPRPPFPDHHDGMKGNFRPGPPGGRHFDSISLFLFLMIVGISTAIRIIRQWQLTEKRALQAEADKTSTELSFLKAQINPHFLFNTLNNIYTLAMMNDEHTAESILKLSNIMRYVTDEVTADFVLLENDINCIKDYIELQRLRLGDSTTVNFSVNGIAEGKTISPLLLMSFVENAFKHGVSKNTPSVIDIAINILPQSVRLFCKNQAFANRNEMPRTGVGLENTRHRLNHLYPGRHTLTILEQNGFYIVDLLIQINQA